MADSLAKLASTSDQNQVVHSYFDLHRTAKGLFQLDKWQMPCTRSKFDEVNFYVS